MHNDNDALRTRLFDSINRCNAISANRTENLLRAIENDKLKLTADCLAGIPASRKK